jgi:hypothetical protein
VVLEYHKNEEWEKNENRQGNEKKKKGGRRDVCIQKMI